MKINRWIYTPFYIAVFFALNIFLFNWILGRPVDFESFVIWLIWGIFNGFLCLYISDVNARRISKGEDQRAFSVKQDRSLVLLMSYEKAFNLCRESVVLIKRGKIKNENVINGTINAKSKISWDTWGEKIDFNLKKINENLTEVEIFVYPSVKTVIVSDGGGWKIAETICNFLKEKDAEINKKVLVESAAVLNDIYVKPFQKESM